MRKKALKKGSRGKSEADPSTAQGAVTARTPPSRAVYARVGFSVPVVGSTARPRTSSASTPRSGSTHSAMMTVVDLL